MTSIEDILGKMRRNPKGIRFNQLTKEGQREGLSGTTGSFGN
jgi:hypothetical protein